MSDHRKSIADGPPEVELVLRAARIVTVLDNFCLAPSGHFLFRETALQ